MLPSPPRMRALIIGVSGQDGAYLAELLLGKGYEVTGPRATRSSPPSRTSRGSGSASACGRLSVAPTDFRSALAALVKVEPDEVYNLAGQSSVGLSFEQPVETLESIAHRHAQPPRGDPLHEADDPVLQRRLGRVLRRHRGHRPTRRRRSGRAAPTPSPRRRRTSRSPIPRGLRPLRLQRDPLQPRRRSGRSASSPGRSSRPRAASPRGAERLRLGNTR